MNDKTLRNIRYSDIIAYIHLPMSAVISILHRVSGMILYVSIFIFLIFWSINIHVDSSIYTFFTTIFGRIIAIVYTLIASIHAFAAARHLFQDFGFFLSRKSSNISAILFLIFAIFVTIVVGVVLW